MTIKLAPLQSKAASIGDFDSVIQNMTKSYFKNSQDLIYILL